MRHDISGNRATTGCVHICYCKNIEKAGKEFVNIVNNVPYSTGINITFHKWLIKSGEAQLSLFSFGSATGCDGLTGLKNNGFKDWSIIFLFVHNTKVLLYGIALNAWIPSQSQKLLPFHLVIGLKNHWNISIFQ